MLALGIETSCDETAAAVVRDGLDIISDVVYTQSDLHCRFGGVVPEIASRMHVEKISLAIEQALDQAGIDGRQVDCIAVTNRPGLLGSLLVGLTAAKMLTLAWGKPIVSVNHVEAHMYAGRMTQPDLEYPAVGLVVSGGHTALYHNTAATEYHYLGGTIDDAAGEAFDKIANLFELGYPGGPLIDRLAAQGDPEAYAFPKSFARENNYKFSFSGLKTAVLYEAMGSPGPRNDELIRSNINGERKADMAASFQKAVIDVLVAKLFYTADRLRVKAVIAGGGVACNSLLRREVEARGRREGYQVIIPPPELCTDNAAMVAGLGACRFAAGQCDDLAQLDAFPRMA
ncbi:tRNA (adenosine(37)-N6)-threonylcarbamoyltransferase complex transferase subunit TsaD [Planctomycetota bacterium]